MSTQHASSRSPFELALTDFFGLSAQAPKWEFALEDPGVSPHQAGPLFLGALPPRPPAAFSAILSFRPNANALSRQVSIEPSHESQKQIDRTLMSISASD